MCFTLVCELTNDIQLLCCTIVYAVPLGERTSCLHSTEVAVAQDLEMFNFHDIPEDVDND